MRSLKMQDGKKRHLICDLMTRDAAIIKSETLLNRYQALKCYSLEGEKVDPFLIWEMVL